MLGMVLAAGAGRRLRPYTDTLPKALVPVDDETTILDLTLSNFSKVGLKDVAVIVGYKSEAVEKRKKDLEALKSALENKRHPIHQNAAHVAAVQRVIADIERLDRKIPGDETYSEYAQHAVGEKESPLVHGLAFGWAKDSPSAGRATAQHMRTAVDVMTGRYGRNTPTTGSQPY